jgi:hypothetical protein
MDIQGVKINCCTGGVMSLTSKLFDTQPVHS